MEELPTQLSPDGIRRFVQPQSMADGDTLILQVAKIAEDCESNKICVLSDGFTEIKGWLVDAAKLKTFKGELLVFNIVKIKKSDYELRGVDKDPAFTLSNCTVINGIIMLSLVGEPISFLAYHHNNYLNNRGSSVIATGQKPAYSTTIKSLTESYPYVPNKWILKARIVKKPDNINKDRPFMVIRLMDETMQTIQGVFFGKTALQYSQRLQYNHEYMFSNGMVKLKKNGNNQFQIKFTQGSQILPTDSQSNFRTGGQNSNQGMAVSEIMSRNQQGQVVTVIGKVNKVQNLRRGRSLQILDRNFDSIEVMLWEQFRDQIQVGETYKFQNVRTKKYNNLISLQSVRDKTVVSKSNLEIFNNNVQQQKNSNTFRSKQYQMGITKELKDFTRLLNVTQLLQEKVTGKVYKDVNGFLLIQTNYLEPKNYFRVQCRKCENKQLILSYENRPQCRKCSATEQDLHIVWNIRCHIIDDRSDAKCVMNEELCIKLLKMSAVQGLILLIKEPEQFKKRINSISHREGMFLMKLNSYKNEVIYYNIVDMYKTDSMIILRKQLKQLKQAMSSYIKQISMDSPRNENKYNIQEKTVEGQKKEKSQIERNDYVW